ncbi:NUDIX hydrolase [Anaerotruncus rubiinfantis]|uniref:NUDIX hydrolase n=1 Tax=Anaerotruncus rubiinfantis TaxID=1720200 RepID=UPI0034A37523
MVEVKFYDNVADELLKFAVIISKTDNKWVFCKHKERETYEVPGGHREPGESIFETAKRELQEETGAIDFKIEPICVYSVKGKTRVNENIDDETFGMLFIADISSFVELHCEIEKILISDKLVDNWTYPLIQPILIEEAKKEALYKNQDKQRKLIIWRRDRDVTYNRRGRKRIKTGRRIKSWSMDKTFHQCRNCSEKYCT